MHNFGRIQDSLARKREYLRPFESIEGKRETVIAPVRHAGHKRPVISKPKGSTLETGQ